MEVNGQLHTPTKRPTGTHWIRGWVKRKTSFLSLPGIEPRSSPYNSPCRKIDITVLNYDAVEDTDKLTELFLNFGAVPTVLCAYFGIPEYEIHRGWLTHMPSRVRPWFILSLQLHVFGQTIRLYASLYLPYLYRCSVHCFYNSIISRGVQPIASIPPLPLDVQPIASISPLPL